MMRRLSILFIICVIVLAGVASAFVRDAVFLSPKQNATPVEVVIAQGSSVATIANQLKQSHVIAHPTFFKWFVTWSRTENKLQAGTFLFVPNSPIASIVLVLSNPKNSEVKVTIPEGYTNEQIKEKFIAAFPDFDVVAWNAQTNGLQGYLFPDTYQFSKNATVKEIVEKMRLNLDKRLIQDTGGTFSELPDSARLHEILTLASIVEREVKTPEDMAHVARVFYNRLFIGMPLQSDADRWTYKNRGLPAQPICNPGLNAIMAVLHPLDASVVDLYFIAPSDHAPVFAKTLNEQIANQRKYLK